MASSRSTEQTTSKEHDNNNDNHDKSRQAGRRDRSNRPPSRDNLIPILNHDILQQSKNTPITVNDMRSLFSNFATSIAHTIKKGKMPRTSKRAHEQNFVDEDFRRKKNQGVSIKEPRAQNGGKVGVKISERYDKGEGMTSPVQDFAYSSNKSSTTLDGDSLFFTSTPNCGHSKRLKCEFTSTARMGDIWFKKKLKQFGLASLEEGVFEGNTCKNTAFSFYKEITEFSLPPRWRDIVIDKYIGKTDPTIHLTEFFTRVQIYTYDERIVCRTSETHYKVITLEFSALLNIKVNDES